MKRSLSRLRASLSLSLLFAALGATGCLGNPKVMRVYDGRLVEGRYVSPDAYAAFLRGVLAEESGDMTGALSAYDQARSEDDDDAEIWARIGEARCKVDPKDTGTDVAFARALKIDPTYASALAAKARCELARGRPDEATELARRAAAADPKNVALEALYVKAEAARPGQGAARERAIALTAAHGSHAAAWDALAAWGRSHRDPELLARGLEGLVRAAPSRAAEVEKGAVALLADGHVALARRVAASVADAPRELGVRGPRDATVARLAVDEALVQGNREALLTRATRGHVPMAEVAARALRLERNELAAELAAAVVASDANASGAHMVTAAIAAAKSPQTNSGKAADGLLKASDQPPELCALVFADRLATAAGNDIARAWLARVTFTPMAAHDPLTGPLATDLVARGILAPQIGSAERVSATPGERPPAND